MDRYLRVPLYGALEDREQHQAGTGRQVTEGEHVYGLDREGLRRAEAREEFEYAEPEEHYAKRRAKRRGAVMGYPLGEPRVYGIERYR